VRHVIYMKCLSFSTALHYMDTFILHSLSSQYAHVNIHKHNVRCVLNQLNFNSRVINEELSWACCQCCKFVDSQVTRKLAFVPTPEATHL